LPNLWNKVDAITVRQAHIQDDQIRFPACGIDDCALYGFRFKDTPSFCFQCHANESSDLWFIFHQQCNGR
jgi:hypothetical protein